MARIIRTDQIEDPKNLSHNDREWVYNGLDCAVTLEVLRAIKPQLDEVTQKTYEFSLALQAPVLDMTTRGMLIHRRRRSELLADYNRRIDRLDHQVTRLVVEGIGYTPIVPKGKRWWRSVPKLKELFYGILGLPTKRKRNAKGEFVPTINRDALESLSTYFMAEPLALHILALRDIDKKRQFLEAEADADNRIRTSFNIGGTNTGRLASSISDYGSGGNLQNVDRELRSVFVADKKMKFANLDLEQGDARNVGAICWNLFVESHGEAYAGAYLDACESGDLHTAVCRMAWRNLPWSDDLAHNREVAEQLAYRQDSYRQLAKKLGHGTNYYGTPRTMAQHTKVETSIITEFQVRYFKGFPAIGTFDHDPTADNYHTWVRKQLVDFGFITTLLGRRRFFFGRPTEDTTLREAIAFSPQSMTAEEINLGILKLWRANRVQLLVQVHDNIVFQYPEEEEDEIVPWAVNLLRLTIPLRKGRDFIMGVDAKTGWNWGDYDERKNPDGLKKFKSHDSRRREEPPENKLSLREILNR